MTEKYKLNIILDLDQTCISSEDINISKQAKYSSKATKFKSHNMDNYFNVFERPHLQTFLDYVFDNFNVSCWTAASCDYGLFIIKHIIGIGKYPNRKIDYYLHSKHCSESKRKLSSTKNLEMLFDKWKLPGYYAYNTVIIDDLPEVYETQPVNCINIKPFEFKKSNSENDNELLKIISQLKLFANK